MKKIKATEPNCLTELTDLKQKAVIYHQDTIDRLIEENIKIKEKYEKSLKEIKEIASFHTTDADSLDVQSDMNIIRDIIDEVLNLK